MSSDGSRRSSTCGACCLGAVPCLGALRLPWPARIVRCTSRTFGRLGWPVSEIGYGLWGMGGWSGSNDDESLAALERSIELGCTFFDTALAYGNGKSEQLLAQVLARHRDKTLASPPRSRRRICDGRRCRSTRSTRSSPPITSGSRTEISLRESRRSSPSTCSSFTSGRTRGPTTTAGSARSTT